MKLTNKILEAVNRGIKFALDDFEDNELTQGLDNSKVKYKGGTKEYLDLMEEVVDLGLPSGTLWCKYNLDVDPNQLSKAKDWYGRYYAWGELEGNKTNKDGKIYFEWDNYKFGKTDVTLTKYCTDSYFGLDFKDNLTLLLPEDDAAYQFKKCHNFKFHIPTKELFEELLKYTTNYWVRNYDPNKTIHNPEDDGGIQGLNGRVFIGKNENLIFIPAVGWYDGSNIIWDSLGCSLWSSSIELSYPYCAYFLEFDSDSIRINAVRRTYGYSLRPVINL